MKTPAPDMSRLPAIKQRTDRLGQAIALFWKKHGPDSRGGFYGVLDEQGRPVAPHNKAVIPQARHLWAFAAWYKLTEPTPEIKTLCDDLYTFLTGHFRDANTEEYFWMTDDRGRPLKAEHCLYADSFVILGLALYARVFSHAKALERAMACFRAIDARAHDAKAGGYDQLGEIFWEGGVKRAWVVEGARKETNTHIHLLESYTTLLEAGHDPLVAARLEELLDLIAYTFTQAPGYVHTQFTADWKPVGPPRVSYGHDVETAWLLYEAASLLGRAGDEKLKEQIVKIGSLSAREGWDGKRGGLFQTGVPGGRITDRTKVWWIQAETVLGLLRLYFLSGEAEWLEKTEKTLDWIERNQVNMKTGEWFENADETGRITGSRRMAHDWKSSYHTLRAMAYASRWIGEYPGG